ncbi:MAG: redoxin domain-containing protein [Chloroflexi bacterium]|nr:redoxin domain-containing protein [Chloroflexota bacterium]
MRKTRLNLVLAILGVSAILIPAGCGNATAAIPNVGDKAPDFTLESIDGQKISLSHFKGKNVLIVFTAVHCVQCEKQLPYIDAACSQAGNNLAVLNIYREDPATRVKKHVQEKQLTRYPALPDPQDKVAALYGLPPKAAPVNIIISADGIIVNKHAGPFERQEDINTWIK